MSSDRLSQVQVLRMLEPWRKGQAISRCRHGRWLVSVVVGRPARSSFSWGPHVTIPAHQPTWLVYHLSCPLPRPRTQIRVSKCGSDRITACAGCASLLRVPSRLLQGRQLGFCHISDETMTNETFSCWWIWKEQTLNDDPGTRVYSNWFTAERSYTWCSIACFHERSFFWYFLWELKLFWWECVQHL